MSDKTLFERLGGEAAVDAAVDLFYDKVLADDRINAYFADVNMERQRAKQKQFLSFAFGGPVSYSGKSMRAAHAKLVDRGMSGSHFDAVAENLQATLQEMGVAEDLVVEVMAIAGGTRNDVLGLD